MRSADHGIQGDAMIGHNPKDPNVHIRRRQRDQSIREEARMVHLASEAQGTEGEEGGARRRSVLGVVQVVIALVIVALAVVLVLVLTHP